MVYGLVARAGLKGLKKAGSKILGKKSKSGGRSRGRSSINKKLKRLINAKLDAKIMQQKIKVVNSIKWS